MSTVLPYPDPDVPIDWEIPKFVIEINAQLVRLRTLWPIASESLHLLDRQKYLDRIKAAMRSFRFGSMLYEAEGPVKDVTGFYEISYKLLAWVVYFLEGYIYAKEAINAV